MRTNVPAADALIDRYFPVLDHGFVALKDYMGGDKSVEQFARTSYFVGEEDRTFKQTRDLIRYLVRNHHTSPVEAVELSFHTGGPIFVNRQWVRHRTCSMNEFSGRYSEMPMIFYEPDREQVCYQSTTNKQGRSGPVSRDTYLQFTSQIDEGRSAAKSTYKWALEQGIAKETARIDLPLSTYTYMYWKMDLHNLLHFINLRGDPHAQWEIRQYADVIAGIVKAVAPICFEAFIDYKFEATSFTRMETAVLKNLLDVDLNSDRLRSGLLEQGVGAGREQDEFIDKLKVKVLKSFDLDVEKAKDAQFFFDKVKANL